jgi:phospholipid N-methyltransferase
MLDLADFGEARTVVEFGAGTGVYTREILNRLRPDGRLLSFELDEDLASAVSARLADPRMRVINDSAELATRYIEEYAEGERADILVSSVPFTSLPAETRDGLLGAAREALKPGGRMLVLQYSNAVLSDLERFFGPVRRRISPVNLPPAFLFACDNPGAGPHERAETDQS